MHDGLVPINSTVLVELADDLEFVQTPDKQYATKTRGTAIKSSAIETKELKGRWHWVDKIEGKTVYFEDFKDGTQVEQDGKKYAFVKFEDIRGYHE